MDQVLIKDLRVRGIVGIHQFERTTPQEIVINIAMSTDTRRAAASDDIRDCVNYETVAEQVRAHAESSKRLTVEALAEDIAKICLQDVKVRRVKVRVEKTQILPYAASVGVEIEREKP